AARAAVLAHDGELVDERAHIGGAAVGQRVDRLREKLGAVVRGVGLTRRDRPEHVERVLGAERRYRNDVEPRRVVAQQPQRPGRVAAGEDKTVRTRRQAVHQLVLYAAQTREALEGAQLQHLVE